MTRVVNESSYPTKTVERIVLAQARDLGVEKTHVTVLVRDAKLNRWSTKQYASGYWQYLGGAWARSEIVIRLPKRGHPIGDYHPYERKREQGKSFPLADWKEALVAVAAHELEHHRQRVVLGEVAGTRARRGRPGSGHRRVDVELRCDLAAYRAWKRYRQARKLPTDSPLTDPASVLD